MKMVEPVHSTKLGKYFVGDSVELLKSTEFDSIRGQVQLILTSPPFPLNNKKSYGNLKGKEYKKWFVSLAKLYSDLICENGSIVIELGNAWHSKRPIQDLLYLESLLDFVKAPKANLRLCQQFVCYNPSRLPSPVIWVNRERIRVTDSYTNLWWIAKSDFPKADNRRILRQYSEGMKALLRRQNYNPGKRPSEHVISPDAFLTDNGGSIPHNVIELEPMDNEREVRLPAPMNAISASNNNSNDFFMRTCRERNIKPHPARMPAPLAAFFIEFLTEPGDIVLDPFAGSNTTGFVAERLERKWISIEAMDEFAEQSKIRFEDPILKELPLFANTKKET